MGTNVHAIAGATEIELYFRNYTFSTAQSDLNNLESVFFTDINRFGYKAWSNTPKAGSLRKFMEDSSGATNIPNECVLFSDQDGRATYDSDFYFDGTDLYVDDDIVVKLKDGNRLQCANGWEIVFLQTGIDLYKDGSYSGISLA